MKILYIPILFLLIVSCAGPEMESTVKSSREGSSVGIQDDGAPGVDQKGQELKNYVPGEVLVKFKENTSKEAIDKIQQDLPLKTVRIVSHPDLYLMKIMDGSSVEWIIQRLKGYDAVKYAEPNYIRKIY